MNFGHLLLAASLVAAPLAVAGAQDDISSKIINDLGSTKANKNVKVIKDAKVQGGKAMRVTVPAKGANDWDISINSGIAKPIKAGDKLVLAFWARLEKGEDGATTAVLPFNGVQVSSAPYADVFSGPVNVGPEWELHEVRGKADKDYAAGTTGVTIHLANAKKVVDFGPVFVLDMGQ